MVFLAARVFARRTSSTVSASERPIKKRLILRRVVYGSSITTLGLATGWYCRELLIDAGRVKAPANPKYVFGSRRVLHEIKAKPSWYRLFQLLARLLHVMIWYPLLWFDPKSFWTLVTKELENSGPCLVKLAQWLSTRRDLFDPEFCESLSRLQEDVHATWSRGIDSSEVAAALEEKGVRFRSLENKPISSGSIAEVFFGELEDGTEVAVKCLRPDIRPLLEGDLAWLLWLGNWAEKQEAFKRSGLKRATEDFCEQVWMQMDFEIEADHLDQFAKTFADSSSPVTFPHSVYAGSGVLVLSWEKGHNLAKTFRDASERFEAQTLGGERDEGKDKVKEQTQRAKDLQKALGIEPKVGQRIAFESLSIFMQMIFRDCFIHGDLHPGNIILRINESSLNNSARDDGSKKVTSWMQQLRHWTSGHSPFEYCFIDVGLALPLPAVKVEALRSMAIAILYADYDRAARVIYNQSPDNSDCLNPALFVAELGDVFRRTRKGVQEQGFLQISDACLGALTLVNKHKVGIDTELTWVLLSMLSIEGVARQFDPLVDATAAASRHIVTLPVLMREFRDGASRESCKQMLQQMILESLGFDYWQYRNHGAFVRAKALGVATPDKQVAT